MLHLNKICSAVPDYQKTLMEIMILMLLVELMEVLSNLKVLLTILMGLQITVMELLLKLQNLKMETALLQ